MSSICFAEGQAFAYFNNVGGLNDGHAPEDIEDNEAADIRNIVFTTGGHITTREGTDNVNTLTIGATDDWCGIEYYRKADGTQYLVGIADDDKVYKMDYSGGVPDGTWDDITGGLAFTVTQNDLADFAIGEDTIFFTDGLGTNQVYSWAGSGNAAALDATAPNAKYVAYHKRQAFAAGDTSNPSLLYFTDVGDITDWSTGLSGNIAVETDDGSIIRGLAVGFDALYIWKDSSIWRLSGTDKDSYRLQRMIYGIGSLSDQSITRLGSDFFFVSSQGDVYLYDGNVTIEKISSKIQGTIDALSFARYEYACGAIFKDDYYFAVSGAGGGQHSQILVFDTYHQAWTKFTGIAANSFCVAKYNNEDTLLIGSYDGFVYNYPEGTSDNGTAIDAYFTSKQFRFPEISGENKDLKLFKVYATEKGNWDLIVEIRRDFESTGTAYNFNLLGNAPLWDTAVYDVDRYSGQNLLVKRIEPYKEGEFFQFKFSNANVDEPFDIKGYRPFVGPGRE